MDSLSRIVFHLFNAQHLWWNTLCYSTLLEFIFRRSLMFTTPFGSYYVAVNTFPISYCLLKFNDYRQSENDLNVSKLKNAFCQNPFILILYAVYSPVKLTEDNFMNQRKKSGDKVVSFTQHQKKKTKTTQRQQQQAFHQNKWLSFLFLLGLISLPIVLYWLFQTK